MWQRSIWLVAVCATTSLVNFGCKTTPPEFPEKRVVKVPIIRTVTEYGEGKAYRINVSGLEFTASARPIRSKEVEDLKDVPVEVNTASRRMKYAADGTTYILFESDSQIYSQTRGTTGSRFPVTVYGKPTGASEEEKFIYENAFNPPGRG